MFCHREKVKVIIKYQQNDKSTQEYTRKLWTRSHTTIAVMGKNVLKASDYKNHRIFTLKCISSNLIPVSIRLRPLKSRQGISASARKIIEKAERQLLQDRVRSTNNTIRVSNNNGIQNKARLASMVTQVDLDKCIDFIEKVRE